MKLGIYKHYKGSICEVIGIAKHSETLEDTIVYKHYDAVKGQGEMTLRVRPKTVFEEKVIVDPAKDGTGGKEVERFMYIGE
ncbi:MAG: DUF1653 domain-containing protein [candidate division SR1 bacterium]|nr:DUF1653 domain-containing protein [candidate division SR1 bacterium]